VIYMNRNNPLCANLLGHNRKREAACQRHLTIAALWRSGTTVDEIRQRQESGRYSWSTIYRICLHAAKDIPSIQAPS
jgi:hypothetical protein